MALRFTTLASGSKGNCALVERDGQYLMIDAGLKPRTLMGRLGRIGLSVADIGEVILTHTHGDHVNDKTLSLLADHGVTFRCHAAHEAALGHKKGFGELKSLNLVRHYDTAPFTTCVGLGVHPIEVRHGAGKTFAFRLNHHDRGKNRRACIGYVADLGCWNERTAAHFRNCRLLAVEFNHDVQMTRESDRHYMVKMRNLSNDGHLSNVQAADLVRAVMARSEVVRPDHLVLLHLSDMCNTEALAAAAAERALREQDSEATIVMPAKQKDPLPWFEVATDHGLDAAMPSTSERSGHSIHAAAPHQPVNRPPVSIQQEFRFPV